jgi:4,5:9,10-diseco-3-hydroxy-5,9,17-trioxoandrosta-1(10),2-diene-4-oate hydrolase
VNVGGYDVAYHEAGEGPALVMLHGGGSGASGWSNFGANLPSYAKHFRTLVVNQPGFGGTGYPEEFDRHYLTFTADLITRFLDELGIERTHVLGNSLGAAAAAKTALVHPERLDRIVLMGTGTALSVGLFAPRPAEGLSRLQEFNKPPGPSLEKMEAFLRTLVYNQDLITPTLVQERFDAAITFENSDGNRALTLGYHPPKFAHEAQLWKEADQIEHETLITWGREDRVQPLDGAFLALQLMTNARLHVIPKCGHWAQVDRKDEFERVSISFLRNAPV